MNKQPVDLYYALNLPPEQALKYFTDKGYILPKKLSEGWQEVWQEAHAKAFTVARVTQMDVLKDIREMVTKSLNDGLTFEQFKKELMPKLQKKGWWGIVKDENGKDVQLGSVRRLKVIYDTNLRTSHMAGRYKDMIENAENRPYWMYDAKDDSKTRPAHKALDGVVYRYDHPFWDENFPPNGWLCRCNIIALSEKDLKDRGLTVETKMPERKITDTGWDYNVGKAAFQPDLEKYDYGVAKQYTQGIVTGKPFELFHKKASEKARWALNSVKKEGLKNSKIQSLAVDYLYKNLSKPDKAAFEYVAILDKEKMIALGAGKQAVKFSVENFAKNIINHPEIELKDYFILPEIVDQTKVLIFTDNDLSEKIICFAKKDKYYKTVIKTTGNKEENFLQSFHITDLKRIKAEKNKKGVKVIYDNLTQINR
nr:phage head morphogenesis protein [bacterium]